MTGRTGKKKNESPMKILTATQHLAEFCEQAAQHDYVTVDTEFLRERTYYSKLCLIQLAYPSDEKNSAVLIDPLHPGLKLDPLIELFRDTSVVKVFHAARQDLEIFWVDANVIPTPLFDTQVAAMVCGFGEQVGYETLVRRICRESLDKSSRFTDWSRRPLSTDQKRYAIGDVTYLRQIYEYLSAELEKSGRSHWVEEEIAQLSDPGSYRVEPREAWRRVKTRTNSGKFLSIVRELAAFREIHAQENNVPRNRVFKDDALIELASTKPKSVGDLSKSRLLLREGRKGPVADGILKAVADGVKCPAKDAPKPDRRRENLNINPALADLLRVLLKSKTESAGVAAKLIAPASDLDIIAAGGRDVPALRGWRLEVFGEDALRLCDGEIALTAKGEAVQVVELPKTA